MKLLAIIDLETTGTDPKVHRVAEIGVSLWSVEYRCTVRSWSILMHGDGNQAERINRIPAALLARDDIAGVSDPVVAWRNLQTVFGNVDAVVAHNAEFDRSFVPESFRDSRPWICTMSDLEWPRPSSSQKLTEIALAHGLGVSGAHRALADVELIARLLERSAELGADIDAMLAKALRPKSRFVADVPRSRNDELKAAGFRWDPDRKEWWRRLTRDDAAKLPFPAQEAML